MANIGAEVGQKMRSAIKAKLLELNCYVDDELPDYIMVMVANKRTKSQMKEDLQLFLAAKTGAFVDWLHIVLKKLKEVTVTNPEVYKKAVKRKSNSATPNINIKKEKKREKDQKPVLDNLISSSEPEPSLTDDLPITANRLVSHRKVVVEAASDSLMQDTFDIPLLSEVNMSTEEELQDLEKKIRSVKSRLGILVESEPTTPVSPKSEPEPVTPPPVKSTTPEPPVPSPLSKERHARIMFQSDEENSSPRKRSVMDRLGRRPADGNRKSSNDFRQGAKRSTSSSSRDSSKKRSRRSDDKESPERVPKRLASRLGVLSKVSVPQKAQPEPEAPPRVREVPSVVKVKPRVLPPKSAQPTKSLLLKAMAEAQMSVTQGSKVSGSLKPEALYTKTFKKRVESDRNSRVAVDDPKLSDIDDGSPPHMSTPKALSPSQKTEVKQQFVITLDGIDRRQYFNNLLKQYEDEEEQEQQNNKTPSPTKVSIKSRLSDKKRTPSPIVFNSTNTESSTTTAVKATKSNNIPDTLPIVHPSPAIKNRERCRYWPSCKQGEKCEFVHPVTNCDKFPHCKFGEKCLYLHPTCKFGSSCTKRGCVYSHQILGATSPGVVGKPMAQICKYYPNCANLSCPFIHLKVCKFGKFCKNQKDCKFSHGPHGTNLTWRLNQ